MPIDPRDRFSSRLRWRDLDPVYLRQLIALARAEDLDGAGLRRAPRERGDVTTEALFGRERGTARLVARQDMVACGLELIPMILAAYGLGTRFRRTVRDGTAVPAGSELGRISGPVSVLLPAERVLLNFLQRLSGIATRTAVHVAALGSSPARLLDTRKTTPGYRMLEKYAVACGGAWNHRLGLFDRVMIKDNHLAAHGATAGARLGAAVERAREQRPRLGIEVEVDSFNQIEPALAARPDVILLDNFAPAALRRAVRQIAGRALTEASGGVSLKSLPPIAASGVDFISCGGLVHQSVWLDIGLDWA
jgi:nicotinate-nucleotide pyrophosphorylase (carboxylating)